jgi:hypothetical protein
MLHRCCFPRRAIFLIFTQILSVGKFEVFTGIVSVLRGEGDKPKQKSVK